MGKFHGSSLASPCMSLGRIPDYWRILGGWRQLLKTPWALRRLVTVRTWLGAALLPSLSYLEIWSHPAIWQMAVTKYVPEVRWRWSIQSQPVNLQNQELGKPLSSSFFNNFFKFNFICMYVCTPNACLGYTEFRIGHGIPRTEFQMVASFHVVARNWTQSVNEQPVILTTDTSL